MRTLKTKTAFSNKDTVYISDIIEMLRLRHIGAYPYTMSWEEALSLWATPEHVKILMFAPHITSHGSYGDEVQVPILDYEDTKLVFEWVGPTGQRPFMPAKPVLQTGELPPPIVQWVKQAMEIRRDWARVKAVFTYFNESVFNTRQIRYVWPSILGLLDDRTKPIASKLATYQVPRGGVPSLPIEVRAAVNKASQTVATGLMLPEPKYPSNVTRLLLRTRHMWNEDGFVFGG